LVSLVTAAGAVVAFGAPAQAAPTCKTSAKDFALPGTADEKVTVKLCIAKISGGHKATATVTAYSWDSSQYEDPRFDDFGITLRVERKNVVKESRKFPLPWVSHPNQTRTYTLHDYGGSAGGWSADATVRWDINNDGKGGGNWGLAGTPTIG